MFNRVCVDTVIDLSRFSFGRPSDLLLFIGFKPLEFFDNIYFESGTDPHSKFKSNVLVCIGAAISAGFCRGGNSVCFFTNSLTLILKLLSPRFLYDFFKAVKVKIGIVNIFQSTDICERAAVSQPVRHKEFPVFGFLSMSVIQI